MGQADFVFLMVAEANGTEVDRIEIDRPSCLNNLSGSIRILGHLWNSSYRLIFQEVQCQEQ